MVKRDNSFFATRVDLLNVLQEAESKTPLEYVAEAPCSPDGSYEVFLSALQLPQLSVSHSGEQMRGTRFLVGHRGNRWNVSVARLTDGTTSTSLDSQDNPGAVILSPGGEFSGGAIIAGWLATRKDVDDGLALFRLLDKIFRAKFCKVKSCWVGTEAGRRLDEGARLTFSAAASSTYDLSR